MRTCSVIVCAHDEERCIRHLLDGVFAQRVPDGWQLREVLVVADGCRDGTEDIVRSVGLREDRLRMLSLPRPNRGKTRAFNVGVATLHDDVVVMFDADVRLAHDGVLASLLAAIDGGAVLASGNDRPAPGRAESWGHAAALGRHLIKQRLKRRGPGPHTVYSCVGRALAMHRTFLASVPLPDVPGEDHYRYFAAARSGLPYAYVRDAVVCFGPARTVADYARQHARFWHGVAELTALFGPTADYGSLRAQLGAVLAAALRHPGIMAAWVIPALLGQFLYGFERYVARIPQSGTWKPAQSTK